MIIFSEDFVMEFSHLGHTFKVQLSHDADQDAPWENSEGHGPVRMVRSYEQKRPGEVRLSREPRTSREVRMKFLYDEQKAMVMARRDGWGVEESRVNEFRARCQREPTPGEIAAMAVRADIDYLRGYVNDEWHYVGVTVTCEGVERDLYGFESNDHEGIFGAVIDMAREIADELTEQQTIRDNMRTLDEAKNKAVEMLDKLANLDSMHLTESVYLATRNTLVRESRVILSHIKQINAAPSVKFNEG